MAYFIFKTFTTAIIIAGISEISKRYTFLATLLAAIPITSVLIFIWMYVEQKDVPKIAAMSKEVFVLVIPSLAFFLLLIWMTGFQVKNNEASEDKFPDFIQTHIRVLVNT